MSDDFMSIPSAFLMTQAGSMRSQMERSLGEARVTPSDDQQLSQLFAKFSLPSPSFSPKLSPKLSVKLSPKLSEMLRSPRISLRDICEHSPHKVTTTTDDDDADANVIFPFGRYGGVTTLSPIHKLCYLLFEENLKFS